MMTTQELNHILDIANAHNIIARGAIASFMAWFLTTEFVMQPTRYAESRIVADGVRKWAVCLGAAIFLWAFGAEVLTIGVELWRVHGAMLGFWLMLIGSAVTVIGNLLLLRTISFKRCGEWVWVAVAGAIGGYTFWAMPWF